MKATSIPLLVLLIGCSRDPAPPTAQSSLSLSVPSTFSALIKQTPLVALVTVMSSVGRDDVTGTSQQPVIVTDLTLHVERRVGKSNLEQVVVTQLGGSVGDRGMQVSDQPLLAPGQRYIVFADPAQKQRPFPIGPAGVLHVVEGRVFGLDGRAVLAVKAEGFVFGKKEGLPALVPSSLVEPLPQAMSEAAVMTALEGFAP